MNTTLSSAVRPNRDLVRQVLNVVLAIGQLVAIALAMSTENGQVLNAEATSANPPIIPAGYAFAIWSFIYPACIGYAIYQALPAQRENPLLRRVGWWTAFAYIGMTLWANMVQLGQYGATVLFMICMLIGLTGAFIGLIEHQAPRNAAERWFVVVPISVHLGWITVATVANTASTLTDYGLIELGLGAQTWAVIMILAAALIGSGVIWVSRGNVGYALTIVWALIGITVANVIERSDPLVATTAGLMALVVAGVLLWRRGLTAKTQRAGKI